MIENSEELNFDTDPFPSTLIKSAKVSPVFPASKNKDLVSSKYNNTKKNNKSKELKSSTPNIKSSTEPILNEEKQPSNSTEPILNEEKQPSNSTEPILNEEYHNTKDNYYTYEELKNLSPVSQEVSKDEEDKLLRTQLTALLNHKRDGSISSEEFIEQMYEKIVAPKYAYQ